MSIKRPALMQHLPPLDAKDLEYIPCPQIVTRGALTLATPANDELKFYKHTSDLIGNNYTPTAKHLNIRSMHDIDSSKMSHYKMTNWSNSAMSQFNYNSMNFFQLPNDNDASTTKRLTSHQLNYKLPKLMAPSSNLSTSNTNPMTHSILPAVERDKSIITTSTNKMTKSNSKSVAATTVITQQKKKITVSHSNVQEIMPQILSYISTTDPINNNRRKRQLLDTNSTLLSNYNLNTKQKQAPSTSFFKETGNKMNKLFQTVFDSNLSHKSVSSINNNENTTTISQQQQKEIPKPFLINNKEEEKIISGWSPSQSHRTPSILNHNSSQIKRRSSIRFLINNNNNKHLIENTIDTEEEEYDIDEYYDFYDDTLINTIYNEKDDEYDPSLKRDALEIEALKVQFPPWFVSTHGLTRANSPESCVSSIAGVSGEENCRRYFHLLDNCISATMIQPLSNQIIENIKMKSFFDLNNNHNQKLNEFLLQFIDDIRIHYIWSMKKTIVDYILKEGVEQKRLAVRMRPKCTEPTAGRFNYPWHLNIIQTRHFLFTRLFVTHSTVQKLLQNFMNKYSDFRILDLNKIFSDNSSSITVIDLQQSVQKQINENVLFLKDHWLIESVQLIKEDRDEIERQVAGPDRLDLMDSFFNCVAALISRLQRNLIQNTLFDLLRFFAVYSSGNNYSGYYDFRGSLALPYHLNLLKIFFTSSSLTIKLEPSIEMTRQFFVDLVDSIVNSLSQLPRLEYLLFEGLLPEEISSDEDEDEKKMKSKNLPPLLRYFNSIGPETDTLIADCKKTLDSMLENNLSGLRLYEQTYSIYRQLNNGEYLEETEKFLKKEKMNNETKTSERLVEYRRRIEQFKKFQSQIAHLPCHVSMHLFLLDCSQLHDWLQRQAQLGIDKILNKVQHANLLYNKGICEQFEIIVNTMTKYGETPDHCVQLIKFVDNVKFVECYELKEKIEDISAANILFLLDYATLSPEELRWNNYTFTWLDNIRPMVHAAEHRLQREKDIWLFRLKEKRNKLQSKLNDNWQRINEFKHKERISDAESIVIELQIISTELEEHIKEKDNINHEEKILETGIHTDFSSMIQEMILLKDPFEKLWQTAWQLFTLHEQWTNGPILEVNAEKVEQQVQHMWRISYRLTKLFKQNNSADYKNALRVALMVKSRLEKFKVNIPIIQVLCNPGLKTRHWDQMNAILQMNITPKEETSLKDLLVHSKHIERCLTRLLEVSVLASKEYALEQALIKMRADWEMMQFLFAQYKDSNLHILSSFDDVQALMEDHYVKTSTMKNSPFVKPFEAQVIKWLNELEKIKEILENWVKVQAAWIYFEPIFSSVDIRQQMPIEGGLFETVDSNWRDIMHNAVKPQSNKNNANANALDVVSHIPLPRQLRECVGLLDQIYKGLYRYLEEKRLFFPRFFFLSNDELLEILSETKDPLRVQPHLKKCFEGIRKLVYNKQQDIIGMCSAEQEIVDFVHPVQPHEAHGLVERWLLQVEQVMRLSLHHQTRQAIKQRETMSLEQWIATFPGQISLAVSCVFWTREVHQSIQNGTLPEYLIKNNSRLDQLVVMVRGDGGDQLLPAMQRITVEALIVLDVHARDIVASLVHNVNPIKDVSDFNWLSQMRYYWKEEAKKSSVDFEGPSLNVQMVTTEVKYANEYLGNSSRLVITPLTDRCYRTLMSAIQLHLGGAPEGPAGTGKTETSKDLAKCVAKQCVVFNCSDGLDHRAMSKFFKGVAQSGAWACFDEFNRIELEVLSVIAQQIQTIQRAIAQRNAKFWFEDVELCLEPTCFIFITMNPGYAGRAELPDNLKCLFRPVAMMVPDYQLIAEISLYSQGFVSARALATKIVLCYKLCSEQLSTQSHYDYGMRAVKSVLTASATLKLRQQQHKKLKTKDVEDDDLDETIDLEDKDLEEQRLILRSIRDVNLPKFLSEDIVLFENIVSDLFPGVQAQFVDYGPLLVTLRQALEHEMHLECTPQFLQRILQIHEMILVRHGLMIIGDTCTGKTTAYKALCRAMTKLHNSEDSTCPSAHFDIINPKSITMAQLYGRFDPVSHEWFDGVIARLFRQHANATEGRQWLVFDGPVDAIWIENMNTVLDDNRKLCLMSGEIIQMIKWQTMIFECKDLEQASPATVSRCGMIYMDQNVLGVSTLINAWIKNELPKHLLITQEDEEMNSPDFEMISLACEWLLEPLLDFVETRCDQFMVCSKVHLTLAFLRLFQSFLHDARKCFESVFTSTLAATIKNSSMSTMIKASVTDLDASLTGTELLLHEDSTLMDNNSSIGEQTEINVEEKVAEIPTTSNAGQIAIKQKAQEEHSQMIMASICMALVWSVGGVLPLSSKDKFSSYFHDLCQNGVRKHPRPKDLQFPRGGLMPKRLTCYDFIYQFKSSYGSWTTWSTQLESAPTSYQLVNTVETVKQLYFLEHLCTVQRQSVLFVGGTGTGKTSMIKNYLLQLNNPEGQNQSQQSYLTAHLNLSARSTAVQIQETIGSKLQRRSHSIYGPAQNRQCLFVFVDDMHMPMPEKYGAQPPLELLRQISDHRFWYGPSDANNVNSPWTRMQLRDFVLIGAVAPSNASNSNGENSNSGSGSSNRQQITSRLTRHFNIYCIDNFDDGLIRSIFQPIVDLHFRQQRQNQANQNSNSFDFAPEYHKFSSMILEASIRVYNRIVVELLPTPTKSHYLFNVRDFSRIIQGVVMFKASAKHGPVPTPTVETAEQYQANCLQLIRLWTHEVYRVFGDRITDKMDRRMLFDAVKFCIEKDFKEKPEKVFANIIKMQIQEESESKEGVVQQKQQQHILLSDDHLRRLYFCEFMKGKEEMQRRVYEEVTQMPLLKDTVQNYLSDYNSLVAQNSSSSSSATSNPNNGSSSPMDLVIFGFVLEHVSRVCRILKQNQGGHALLIGLGGTGRASVTRLAAYIVDYDLFQIDPRSKTSYTGAVEWRADLKQLLRKAGLVESTRHIVFLFSDTQIKEDMMLEDINMLLNTGEIPSLFDNEEKLEIINHLQQQLKESKDGSVDTSSSDALYVRFISRVRTQLHLVLTFSPLGDQFRSHLRLFPSLLNCCTVDWLCEWPQEALLLIASKFLEDIEIDESIRPLCAQMCSMFHQSTLQLSDCYWEEMQRHNYVTPTAYLELLKTFRDLLESKRMKLIAQRERYVQGVDRLEQSEQHIAALRQELTELQPLMVKAKNEAETLIVIIEREASEVDTVKQIVEADKEKANRATMDAQAIKDECEEQLEHAMPALQEAIHALNTLKPQDISAIKSMQNPPPGVRLVMEAVCIMKGLKPERKPSDTSGTRLHEDYWPVAKRMLSDMHFLDSLRDYDKNNIQQDVINRIRHKYISNPDFDPDKIKNVSSACQGLCKWIIALSNYDQIYKIVAPKKESLRQAQEILNDQMIKLETKRAELEIISKKLQLLCDKLAAKQIEQRELEHRIQLTKVKLQRAEKLSTGLSTEKIRWQEQIERIKQTYDHIVGDVLLSSGIIAYLGAFTANYRSQCVAEWLQQMRALYIPVSRQYSLCECLCSSSEEQMQVREWQQFGLPGDQFSIENALISVRAQRWPLFIDPQLQANQWLKQMERFYGLKVLSGGHGQTQQFRRTLENCIQFGQPLLIEDVQEELDAVLEPILLKQIYRQNGIDYLRLGENTVIEYSNDFRLYLSTRLRNPHLLPEVGIKVKVINMVITEAGLQDQLLGLVSQKEKPELEERKLQLMQQSVSNRRQLQDIEDRILEVLLEGDNGGGDLLDDEKAVEVLSSSKVLAEEIAEKQEVATVTEQQIDATRNQYKQVASHSTVLFFAVADLANIDPMYQFSLDWFIKLYEQSIETSEKSDMLNVRIRNLNSHFTYSLFRNVCLSLFEKDKLLFSFILCASIMKANNEFDSAEWRFLITGGLSVDNTYVNPHKQWLSDKSWSEIVKFTDITSIPLKDHVTMNGEPWRLYAQNPNLIQLPYDRLLTRVQRLIVVKIFRPDCLVSAVQQFVKSQMGTRFTDLPTFNLEESYAMSDPKTPLIFVLSPGVDPLMHLFKLAEHFHQHLDSISLGQGQGPKATQMIQNGIKDGSWVVLQNCHVAKSFLPELETICVDLKVSGEVHKDFRLWLTSYPTELFPIRILENAVKMTNEAPKGLRANLFKIYMDDPISNASFFNEEIKKPKEWKKLLFGLCFFHAVIQQRRRYGALGWNIPYEFNESDLLISMRQLKLFLNSYDTVPLDALNYLTAECNYGGRVTDNFDRRLIKSLLSQYYCEQMYNVLEYKFTDEDDEYYVPDTDTHDSYVEHIRNLPQTTNPDVFGLNSNANITRNTQETQQLLNSILLTLPRQNTSGKNANQNIINEIAKDILNKIPHEFDIKEVQKLYPVLYEESMNIVLVQELIRFNGLISVIRESIQNVKKAVHGLIVMSSSLEQVFNSLLIGKVPELWVTKSYPSLKSLGNYISDLCERLNFFKHWIEKGPPSVFWLSGFFFTQSFLTGIMQNYVRKYHISIDQLDLDFEFMNEKNYLKKPDEGAYIRGLFLQGAKFCQETKLLQESNANVIFDTLPIIWIKLIVNNNKTSDELKNNITNNSSSTFSSLKYKCPVYKTSLRRGILSTTGHSTNYVLTITIPSDKKKSHWINRGVAALCQLDE